MQSKVKTLKQIVAIARSAKKRNKKIVATNGCFDILHVGHVRNLAAAKKLGDVLIVGINSDASVRESKGPARPIVPQKERAEVLAALESVDYVFIFSGRTPFAWIKQLKPDVHVKGAGKDVLTNPDFQEQKRVVEAGGGRMVVVRHHAGKSTSGIVEKIKKL